VAVAVNNTQSALYAANALSSNSQAMSAAVERLSSGLRVRQASDDASGVGISEQIRQQIGSLNQGIQNANIAVSAVQTADASLGDVANMLGRMKELAVQGRNDSLSLTQRQAISDEIKTLRQGINDVASRTTFNENSLLKSALVTAVGSATGAGSAQTVQSGTSILNGLLVRDIQVNNAAEGRYALSFNQFTEIENQKSRITTKLTPLAGTDDSQGAVAGGTADAATITLTGIFEAGDQIRYTVKGDSPDQTTVHTYTVTAENLTRDGDGLSPTVAGNSVSAYNNISAGIAAQYNAGNISEPDATAGGGVITFAGAGLTDITVGVSTFNRGAYAREVIITQADSREGNLLRLDIDGKQYQWVVGASNTPEQVAAMIESRLAQDYSIRSTREGAIVTLESFTGLEDSVLLYQVQRLSASEPVMAMTSTVSVPVSTDAQARTITINDFDLVPGRELRLQIGNPENVQDYRLVVGSNDTAETIAAKLGNLLTPAYGSGASAVSVSGNQVNFASALGMGMSRIDLSFSTMNASAPLPDAGPAQGITAATWGVGGRLDDGFYELFYNDSNQWVVVTDPVPGFTSTFDGAVLTSSPGNSVNVRLTGTPKPGDRVFFEISDGNPITGGPSTPLSLNPSAGIDTVPAPDVLTRGIMNDTQVVAVSGTIPAGTYDLAYDASLGVWDSVGTTYSASFNSVTEQITLIDNPTRGLAITGFSLGGVGVTRSENGDDIRFSVANASGSPSIATLYRSNGASYSASSGPTGFLSSGTYSFRFNGTSWTPLSGAGTYNGTTLNTGAGSITISASNQRDGDQVSFSVNAGTGTATATTLTNAFYGATATFTGSDPLVEGSYRFTRAGGVWSAAAGTTTGATYNGTSVINGSGARTAAVYGIRQGDGTTIRQVAAGDELQIVSTGAAFTFTYDRNSLSETSFAVAGGLAAGSYLMEYNAASSGDDWTIKDRFGNQVDTASYDGDELIFSGGDRVDLDLQGTPIVGDKVYFTITTNNVISSSYIEGREGNVSSQNRDRSDRVITINQLDVAQGNVVTIGILGKEYATRVESGDDAASIANKLAGLIDDDLPNTAGVTRLSVDGNDITLHQDAYLGIDDVLVSVRQVSNPGQVTLTALNDTGQAGLSQTIDIGQIQAGGQSTLSFDRLGVSITLENQRDSVVNAQSFAADVPLATQLQIDAVRRMATIQIAGNTRSDFMLTGLDDIRLTGQNRAGGESARVFNALADQLDLLAPSTAAVLSEANFGTLENLVESAIETVSQYRSELGVQQNRLAHSISKLENMSRNLGANFSQIMDADLGAEMARLTRLQIGRQAATAMMAQANLLPEVILSLLEIQPS
jgi:flagellin-like hook-associated protein FlgL